MILKIPTKLSDKQIEEYQRIYKKTYSEDISKEEAAELGLSLIRLIALVLNRDGK